MTDSSRRTFIKVAGVGAVAAGAAVAVPSVASAAPATTEATLPAGAVGSLVAYVKDVAKGEIVVMLEDREFTVRDSRITALLATVVHTHRFTD